MGNQNVVHLLRIWMYICVLLLVTKSAPSSREMKTIKGILNIIKSDIETLQEKLWIHVIPDIEDMKTMFETGLLLNGTYKDTTIQRFEKEPARDILVNGEYMSVKDKQQMQLLFERVQKVEQLIDVLLKAVKNQKTFTTNNIQDLNDSLTRLKQGMLTVNISSSKHTSFYNDKLMENSKRLTDMSHLHTNLSLTQMEISQKVESMTERIDKITTPVIHSYRAPSFVSDWILMKSQDDQLSQVTVAHGLGVVPYKVEVQITPLDGPNAGWIFQGASAFQADDDYGQHYGGVGYFYNDSHVLLLAPNKNNNKDAGRIIYTGQSESMYQGNHHQAANEAFVRVKVWAPEALPKPAFISGWKTLNCKKKESSYYDVDHGLKGYPDLVVVQIGAEIKQCGYLISEGVGASMTLYNKYSHYGGVLWATGQTSIRVWARFSSKDGENCLIFGHPDGWGINKGFSRTDEVKFRILAWSKDTFTPSQSVQETHSVISHLISINAGINLDTDLISFFVSPNDGNNEGYRFHSYGNSQAIVKPYGGAIYAYYTSGSIRIWKPNPSNEGYMVHVLTSYGAGVNSQASNNVTYGAIVIKTSDSPCCN